MQVQGARCCRCATLLQVKMLLQWPHLCEVICPQKKQLPTEATGGQPAEASSFLGDIPQLWWS